jgi:hypothetical protein
MADDEYGTTEQAPEAEVESNEDGSVTVKLAPQAMDMPEEAFNLVPHFIGSEDGKKFLKKLSKKCMDHIAGDWDDCEPYRKKRKTRFKLLTGNLDPKSFPFEDCANIHVPVMLERSLRVVHRLYAEMFPERDFVFTAIPAGKMGQDRADVITQHSNWQIRKEIQDFFRQNRRGLMEFVVNGDVIFYSSRDIPGKRNRHEALNCEEVIIPYHWKSTAVDLSDIPRKTRILRKYKHELLDLERDGVYSDVQRIFDKIKDPTFDTGPELIVRPEVDKAEGRDNSDSSSAYYILYEYHGWCKLPGQEFERPVVVTLEEQTSTVVGLFIREQEDWKDRARFETQMEEMQLYQQSMDMHQQAQAQTMALQQRIMMPDVPPDERMALEQMLNKEQMPPPQTPPWMEKNPEGPLPVRKVPIEYFSHGVCIENIDGSLGMGIGSLLEEFNKTANTVASQFIDSATLANTSTIIKPESVRLGEGDKILRPGEIHNARGTSSDSINNAFKVIQFPPANPQLMEMVKLTLESADGVSSAPDVLSGEAGKANETYRGIATRVEQATKQLTVLAQNYLEMLGNVMRNNARLNAVFMDDSEIKSVIDPRTLETQELELTRSLYDEDFEIIFTADTRFASKAQRVSEADEILSMIGQALPPPIAQLMFNPEFVYNALVKSLKARGAHEMIRYIPKPPPGASWPGQGPPPPGGPPGPDGPPPGGPPPGPPQ